MLQTLLAAKSTFRRKLGCLPQRLNQTALVSYALARDIEGCTMIDRSTDHRQADRDVNTGLQSQYLDRAVALIMVHRNDHVVIATASQEKERVGRQRALHIPTSALTGLDGRRDFRCLLASAEEPVFTGMRVDGANADLWMDETGANQYLMPTDDDPFDEARLDLLDCIQQTD